MFVIITIIIIIIIIIIVVVVINIDSHIISFCCLRLILHGITDPCYSKKCPPYTKCVSRLGNSVQPDAHSCLTRGAVQIRGVTLIFVPCK